MMEKSGVRILVVDDDADSVRVLIRLLGHSGFTAIGACGFSDAVAAVKADAFDLVLCDIGMPNHDGYELLLAMRSIRRLRVFAVTGYGMASDIEAITSAGFDDLFVKPFDLTKLLTAVHRVANEVVFARRVSSQPSL